MSIGNSLAGLFGLGTVLIDNDFMRPKAPVSYENRVATMDLFALKPENGYRNDCNPGYIDTLVKLNNDKEFKDLSYSDFQWQCLSKDDSVKYGYNGVLPSYQVEPPPAKTINKCPDGYFIRMERQATRGAAECVPLFSGQRIDPDVLDELFPVAKGSSKDKQRSLAIALSAAAIASFALYYMYKK